MSSSPSNESRRPATTVIVGAVVGLVLVLAVVAVLVSRKDSSSAADTTTPSSVEVGAVASTGDALAALPESGDDPAVGKPAPSVAGQGFDGSTVDITPGTKPMIVMFVAHWCPHCQREVPLVVKWAPNGVVDGVELRAVATSTSPDQPNFPPSAWLAKEKWVVPTIADDASGTAANAYGLTAFPYFVVVDAKGNVVKRTSGELSEEQFRALAAAAKA